MKNPDIAKSLASKKIVRTVNPFTVIRMTVLEASRSKAGIAANVEHGGGVNNSYGYPADSECVGAVAVRTHGRGGKAYCRYACIPANKITNSGAANATLGERAPWDNRMTDVTAAYAALRETCWRVGDIRWIERASGVWYIAAGYGWRSASPKIMPAPTNLPRWYIPPRYGWRSASPKRLTGKQAVRAMRRICPDGWRVVMTPASQGARPSPAWASGAEEYHIAHDAECGKGVYDVRGTIALARAAFAQRAAQRATEALTALLDSGAANEVYVCAADSYRAGNCEAGTRSFAARHALDTARHYRAQELLTIANGDARYVRAAILAGLRREKAENQRGYALLAEHGK